MNFLSYFLIFCIFFSILFFPISCKTSKNLHQKNNNLDIDSTLEMKSKNSLQYIKTFDIFFDQKDDFLTRSKNILKNLYKVMDSTNIEKIEIIGYNYQSKSTQLASKRAENLKLHLQKKYPLIPEILVKAKEASLSKKYNSTKDNRANIIIYQKKH